ncbi:hypothetical protein NP603_17510 [Methylomonas sp. SURF-1]|uniref:Uncharacterized protein n=1 Tax=Methylomonas aurea TaxID=2952224 RepID=A0ABT1UL23_9GAMM|nr:hypothetical protein [Methylomonas sp. SURF-1]MCQ8182925.1 hypothetical protein [Methylomonas sp. SURF-1]
MTSNHAPPRANPADGESLFLRKIFRNPLTDKSAEMDVTAHAFGNPDTSAPPRFDPTRGSKLRLSHDLTPFREVLQVFSASLRKPARRPGYRGLKIFTLLTLRFQDFQRLFNLHVYLLLSRGNA